VLNIFLGNIDEPEASIIIANLLKEGIKDVDIILLSLKINCKTL
jgi:hypothetical protein